MAAIGGAIVKQSKKSGGKSFARLPNDLLAHVAVTTLDHAAYRVMTLLASVFRGFNNGAVGMTANQAAEYGIASDNTFYRALRTLVERGLIEQTYPASRVPPRPAMFALSWLPYNDTKFSKATKTPSFAYRNWQPEPHILTSNDCGQRSATIAVMEPAEPCLTATAAAMEAFSPVPQPQPLLTSKISTIGGDDHEG